MRLSCFLTVLCLILVGVGYANPPGDAPDPFAVETTDRIATILTQREHAMENQVGVERLLTHESLSRVYLARDYAPLWTRQGELLPAAAALLEHLRQAGEHGLCGDHYLLNEIEGLIAIRAEFSRHGLGLAPFNRAVLDLFLTQSFLTYATHLVEGQVDPALTHVDWRARRRKADLVKLLQYAVENDRVSQVLDDLLPAHEGYRRLQQMLSAYTRIAAFGGFPEIPAGETLRPGATDPRLPVLRAYLQLSGDLLADVDDAGRYDRSTEDAVRAFQARHGLMVDGVVGPQTLAALNVPVWERLHQIELNLERWRWLPKDLGKLNLQVNIADFSLVLVERDRPVMTMPVIVGTPYRKTPVFSARMTYLEFAPYWTVPETILREDKLPKIKADPGYLERNHYRILRPVDGALQDIDTGTIDWTRVKARHFPGILRMEPGPWNPLGRVKFMFPNGFDVYLHDTNEPYLFSRDVRSFSSGCIRIQRPHDLAQYLLEREGGWDCDGLLDLLQRKAPEIVNIQPLPVHILYWTAWVDPDGSVQFRDDIYWRDLDLDVALTEPAYRVNDQLMVSASTGYRGESL